MTQTELFPEFKLEIVDTFETAKQEIVRYKALYDEMLHHYNRMRVENERLKENERDMLKASTLVTALNENHQLRDEVTLLKRSLKKAMSDLNLVRRADSSSEEHSTEEKPLPPEEKDEEEEKPPSEEKDEARCFSPMVFKKTNYFSDEEGNMYEMNADSSVGDLVGTFRVVDGKYKVKMIRK